MVILILITIIVVIGTLFAYRSIQKNAWFGNPGSITLKIVVYSIPLIITIAVWMVRNQFSSEDD